MRKKLYFRGFPVVIILLGCDALHSCKQIPNVAHILCACFLLAWTGRLLLLVPHTQRVSLEYALMELYFSFLKVEYLFYTQL